jgi:hypothetical protein
VLIQLCRHEVCVCEEAAGNQHEGLHGGMYACGRWFASDVFADNVGDVLGGGGLDLEYKDDAKDLLGAT